MRKNTFPFGTVAIVAAVTMCLSTARADAIVWRSGVDGSWSEDAKWNPSRQPADLDAITIGAGGTYTVAMPQSDLVLRPNSFRITANNGSTITIDGRGGSFTMPACDADTYVNEPWGINASKGHFFNLETYNLTDNKKHAIVSMTNAHFTVSCANDDARLDIWDGFMNFYDPCGVAYASHPFTTAAYTQNNLEIHVHSNAHLRLPTLNFRANALGTNLIAFHGGGSEVLGTLNIPSKNFTPALHTTGEILATDGAVLSLNNVTIGGDITLSGVYYISTNRTARISADKGSEIVFNGALNHPTGSRLELDFRDGATATFNGEVHLAHGSMATSAVCVADATLKTTKTFALGKTGLPATAYSTFHATNSTISIAPDLSIGNGVFCVKDCTTTVNHFYPGYQGNAGTYGEAIFDGGKVSLGVVYCGLNRDGGAVFRGGAQVTTFGSEFLVGKDANTYGDMTIEDDDTSVTAKATGSGKQINIGLNGHGTLRMKGGTLLIPSNGLYLGDGSTSTGIVEQTGGDIVVSGSEGLLVGHVGWAEYTISGGTLTTPQIRLAWQGGASNPTNVMRIAGGLVSVTTTEAMKGVNVCDSQNTKCRLELRGGVLQGHRVRGWTGASAKGGGGWAVLDADGGTIRAHTSSDGFVENFDEAVLGAKGLTLESAYPVTISQNFADKPGEAGRLVLAGSAVKTLTGAASEESVLEIVDGVALFASGASHHSAVVVTNSAVLSFAGASSGATFKGLALGSAETMGILAMELSDRIVLEAEPTFGNFSVRIADATYAVGAYPLITCPGEASAATVEAWKGGYVAEGRIEGMAYSFTAAYDAEAGKTVFSLVVAEGSGITGESVWKGPGSQWGDAANWDAEPPDGASAAVFSSESAPSPVNVGGEQIVGALDFTSAKGYVLEGAGSIRMSDSGSPRVTAAAGSYSIGVGLSLPSLTDFDVTSPAVLTVAGPVRRGGIVKLGTGRLQLESPQNEIAMGLRVSEGMLSLASFAASGMAGAAFRQATLDGGTLELRDGAAGTMPFSLVVQGGEKEAVGFKNDADVTVTSASVTGGDIVKRGAGTLTFDMAGATLSADNGTCILNGNPATGQQYFPSNGVMPTAGYCGFNVADGEVVLKTGTYSIPNAIAVGLVTLDVSDAEPAFTVDGATVNTGMASYHFLLGPNAYANRTKFTRPRLTVKNGGYLSANTLNVGKAGDRDIYPEILLDNGTLYGSWCINISERSGSHATYTIRNGSKMLSNTTVNWRGPAELTFTDSVFAKDTSNNPIGINVDQAGGTGTWLFGANSTFHCSGITHKFLKPIAFAFDGGRWVPSWTGSYNFLFQGSDHITIETLSEKGLRLGPGSGREWRMAKAVTGAGGVVMDGAGTLRFVTQEILQTVDGVTVTNKIGAAGTIAAITNPCTLDFAGPMDIASGSVVAEEGAVRTNAVFTGAGTLSAVNCPAPKFLLSVGDDYTAARVLTLNGFSTVGGATVDLGRTVENPLKRPFRDIVVAHYTGAAPDVSAWKAVGTGLDMVTGACRAEGGDVILTLRTSGSVLIFK